MICPRCGTKYDDNAAACPVCSQQTVQPPQYEDNYQPPPQYTYSNEQQADPPPAPKQQTYYNYGQEYSGTKYNKRKRRKKVTSLIISLSTVLILLAVFLLNFNAIVGFCIKTFASPDVYFAYVEKRAAATSSNDFISVYADFKDNMLTDTATEGKLSLNLGSRAKEQLGGDNFDWLDDFYISAYAVSDGKNNKSEMTAYVGDTMLLGVEAYVDDSGNTILGFPGLTDKYLSLVTENGNALSSAEIKELLPSQKTVSNITSRYTKIIKKYCYGTRRATEDFVIDGVEQKLIMLELNITRADMIDMLSEIASALKEDEEALEIVWNISNKLVEKEVIDKDDDLVAEVLNELDDFLKTLEDARTNVEIEIPTFRYRNFVNMNHDIVGKEITVNDKNILYFLNVQDGKEVGSEIRIGKAVTMIGYGTKKDGKYNIEYAMTNSGAQLGSVTVSDLCFDKKERNLSGSIKILPTARLIYESGLPTDLAKMGVGIDLSFDLERESSSFTINILSDGKLYFGINNYTTVTETETVTVPKEKVFNGENESDAFFKSFDFESLEKNIKKASLPETFIELIQYFELMQKSAYTNII